jgi:hypothetical protein
MRDRKGSASIARTSRPDLPPHSRRCRCRVSGLRALDGTRPVAASCGARENRHGLGRWRPFKVAIREGDMIASSQFHGRGGA